MSKLAEVISNIPDENLRKYLTDFAGALKDELSITVSRVEFQKFEKTVEVGFDKVNRAIAELAEAQKKTEQRVEELAEAQKRTEERLTRLETAVAELAEAQKRTGERLTRLETAVAELAEAQKKTEQRVKELAEAQKQTEESLTKRMDRFDRDLMALGARWGIESEQSFRNGMRDVIEDIGYKVENVEFTDEEGVVFGKKAQIEIDIVVKDGKTIAIEIKSSISKGDLATFRRKVELYEEIFGRKVDELMVISPFIDPRATVLAHKLNIRLATSEDGLNENFD